MELNIILGGLVGLLLINAVVSLTLPFLDWLLNNFIMRGKCKGWGLAYQKLKYKRVLSHFDGSDQWLSTVVLDVICGFVIISVLASMGESFGTAQINPLWLLVPASPFIARFVVDVCRTLKLKNGESQRIKELENKVEELSK